MTNNLILEAPGKILCSTRGERDRFCPVGDVDVGVTLTISPDPVNRFFLNL